MFNIVITGASKGMGKAMAEKFAAAKNNIFICSRNEKELAQTANELNEKYNHCVNYFPADLSQEKEVLKFADWLLSKNISIDILINNAGQFVPGSVYNEPEGNLEKMMNINLFSAYHLTRALLPQMMKKKSGHIFNICSIAALKAYSNGGSYSISKFALAGFSKNLREEMKPFNIKVTAVYPGAVLTASWEDAKIPMGRIMEVEDVANMIFTAACLSPQACVEDIVIRPLLGDLP
ncbi:MAG TPA: SDR family oxidoreductase [Hanamia sp.]|nr:SDR family oxidoreductase [Hanamia sp.]